MGGWILGGRDARFAAWSEVPCAEPGTNPPRNPQNRPECVTGPTKNTEQEGLLLGFKRPIQNCN